MKIVTAIAVGLGAWMAGTGIGQSDEILFPYIVRSPTVTSVVSVVNIEPPTSLVNAQKLTYTYFHKSGNAAAGTTTPCVQISFRRVTSPNDIQTFDVGNALAPGDLGVLFSDPSINNDYRTAGQSYSGLAAVVPPGEPDQSEAFLIVDNNDLVDGQFAQGRLYGEAVILDFASGAVWSYRAYNAGVDEALRADGQLAANAFGRTYTFSNQFETEGEVLNGAVPTDGQTPVHLLPDDGFGVRFLVTPIAPSRDLDGDGGLDLSNTGGNNELGDQRQTNLRTRVRLAIATVGGVAYDRDENPISGPLEQDVVCVGGVDVRGQLLSQGVLDQLKQGGTDGGGWSFFQTLAPPPAINGNDTPEAVVLRLDFSRASANLAVAVWLRNATDRHAAFESLMPSAVYDVPVPANVQTNGPDGLPNLYNPAP